MFLCNKVKNQLEKSLGLLKKRFLQRHFLAKNIYPSLWSRSEEDLHQKYRTFGKSSYCKDERDFDKSILSGGWKHFFQSELLSKRHFLREQNID